MKKNRFLYVTILVIFSLFLFFNTTNTLLVKAIDTTNQAGHWSFDEGSGSILTDHSIKGYDGTINNAEWIPGISGTALHFNGVDSYVEIPSSDDYKNLQELTVSFWFKTDTSAVWTPIINKGYTNEGITDVFEINIDYGEKVSFTLNFNHSGRKTYTTPQNSVSINTWHHFVGVFNGDYLFLYIDGILVAEHDVYNELLKTSDAPIFIGIEYESPDQTFFEGAVDEVNIFSRPISSDEVLELFSAIEPDSYLSYTSDSTTNSYEFKSNNAIEKSPLNGIVPREIVPVIATVISITALILWQLIGGIIIDFLSDYTSEKLIDSKGTGKSYTKRLDNIIIPKIPLKTSELFTIFLTAIVFSFALSWTWGSTLSETLFLFVLNLFIIGFIYIIRELIRIHYSNKLDLKTDHVFWPFGAIVTVVSSLLGNTFSLASYNTAENENDGRYAKLLLTSTSIFYVIALASFLLNYIFPHIIFQMVFILLIMTLMIDMTPIKPMDGDIIRKWNVRYFIPIYAIVIVSYIVLLFITL